MAGYDDSSFGATGAQRVERAADLRENSGYSDSFAENRFNRDLSNANSSDNLFRQSQSPFSKESITENSKYIKDLKAKYDNLFDRSRLISLGKFKSGISNFTIRNPLTDQNTRSSLFSSQPSTLRST